LVASSRLDVVESEIGALISVPALQDIAYLPINFLSEELSVAPKLEGRIGGVKLQIRAAHLKL
jgi:hypothetical protein